MRKVVLPAAIAAALLLAGCTPAAPTPSTPALTTPATAARIPDAADVSGTAAAYVSPSSSYARTVGPNSTLKMECRKMTDAERRLIASHLTLGVAREAVVDLDAPWRIIAYTLNGDSGVSASVVTNGTRYGYISDVWQGGYAGVQTMLVDGPRALAAAEACVGG